ncbi:MAG TPA: ABC transporter permease [Ktedonobacteraceae bacterium]
MAKSTLPAVESAQERGVVVSPSERSAGQKNTLRNIVLIFQREYKNQVTRRSFMVISIIYLLAIIVGSFVPTIIQYVGAHSNSQTSIVLIDNAGDVAGMSGSTLTHYVTTALNGQAKAGNVPFAVTLAADTALKTTQNAAKNGQTNVLLVLDRAADQELRFTYYTTSSDPTDGNTVKVQTIAGQLDILDRAERQHLNTAQISSLFAHPQFTITNLQQGQNNRSTADWVSGLLLAYAGIILTFMTILIYGVSVAQGVAEEKGNLIIEILVLAATPFQLMVGKIIGIGAAGLTQMTALVAVGIGMFSLQIPIQAALLGSSPAGLQITITGTSITLLLLILLYFILAFALYSSLYAAVGALVQRQEDAQKAGMPVTMLFMVGYIISLSVVSIPGVPDSTWFKVMSYIPFWTPTMMLARIGVGTVAWWEILLTIGLMLLAFPICAWISARIYRYGILMYGQKRMKLGNLISVIRAG